MHTRTVNQTPQNFQQHQHPVKQILKKYPTPQTATTNRNVHSAYNAANNRNSAVPRSYSVGPYRTCPHLNRRVNNANRDSMNMRSPISMRPQQDLNTQVIFKRVEPFDKHTKSNVKNDSGSTYDSKKIMAQKNVMNEVQMTQTPITKKIQGPRNCAIHGRTSNTTDKPMNIQASYQSVQTADPLKQCDHSVHQKSVQPEISYSLDQETGTVPEIPKVHEQHVGIKNLSHSQTMNCVNQVIVSDSLKVSEYNLNKNTNSDSPQGQQKVEVPIYSKQSESKNKNRYQSQTAGNNRQLQEKSTALGAPKKNEQTLNKNVSQQKQTANKTSTQQQKFNNIKKPLEQKGVANANMKKPELRQYPKEYSRDSEVPANLNFKTVTQELANIIKNFQRQIHDVPVAKAQIEEVPSAMLQPKIKEFFKGPCPSSHSTPSTGSNNNNNIVTKSQNNSNRTQNNRNQNNNIKNNNQNLLHKQPYTFNSLGNRTSSKSLSTHSSLASRRNSITPFRSLTQDNMLAKSSSYRGFTRRPLYTDPLKQLKDEVQTAIRQKKTFTVRGQFPQIRKALVARGWVEKYHPSYKDHLHENLKRYQSYSIPELLPLMRREDCTAICKNLIKSKLLGGYQVDFYWGFNDDAFKENPDKVKYTLINKLKREIFSYTNKQGLCDASKFSYWYQQHNVSKLNHPRTYSLGKNGDLRGFIEDFHFTAAMSLLKWVVKIHASKECKLTSPYGKIPLEAFDFAVNECCKFIKRGRHEDIDMRIVDAKEKEWEQFLNYFYKLVHYNNHFKSEENETEDSIVRKSNYILNNLKSFYHFVDMDGMMNIWILKPTASSRGRGIHMCRTLQYVLKVIKQNSNVRYIIQKYIERPLLIYNTKFDIRQWFLISNCCPLTIWMYKECYLRFSSQTYNLRKLHESIHLTNNSVQCKYKNTSLDAALPSYNMWDSHEFEKYLSNIGYPKVFKNVIYPGMKQSITAAVLMHQDKMVVRRNSFELYGADFILTEDFQPWLLEINSSPALYASTPVTARMCPKVLEDVIKVVVDYARNNKANTGSFEMIYKQHMTKLPEATSLEVKGTPLTSNYFFNDGDQELNNTLSQPASTFSSSSTVVDYAKDSLKMFGDEIKKTLKNLLQIIQNEKQKRGLNTSKN